MSCNGSKMSVGAYSTVWKKHKKLANFTGIFPKVSSLLIRVFTCSIWASSYLCCKSMGAGRWIQNGTVKLKWLKIRL